VYEQLTVKNAIHNFSLDLPPPSVPNLFRQVVSVMKLVDRNIDGNSKPLHYELNSCCLCEQETKS